MRRGSFIIILILLGIIVTSVLADEKTEKPYGLAKRTPWTTSKVVGSPEPPLPYRLDRVFPKLAFKGPTSLMMEPGTNRMLVSENAGKIFAFPVDDPNTDKPELFLDAGREVYAFSFHPKYKENGYIYVFCPNPPANTPKPLMSRVSRYQTNLDGPRKVKPGSETIIIEWPSGGHNGGEAIFGPDGYLYICTGDGTSGSDPDATGQGVNDLLSVMIRIDVDHPDPGRQYSIPRDNPFINYPGARPEVWAHGFRNPWRMSFDEKTGRLWLGDVGQDIWEMIRVVEKGGNYGWSVQEGSHPFHPHKKVGPGPIIPPIVEHHHTECRSITGGYVYHGSKFPELRGAYIYGDYQYGKIWALWYDGSKVTRHEEIADTAVFIASFTLGRDGDIYAVDNSTGFIVALARVPTGTARSSFPMTLKETGLFTSIEAKKPAPGVIPYDVNAPYWADGAHLDRYFGLPGSTQIGDANSWAYPDGMVAAQTLSIDLEEGNPKSKTPIETRILVKQDDHWMGYSYLWNETRTDANLVGANGADRAIQVKDSSAPGGGRSRNWRVPARSECMFCHSRAAGFVLGINTPQLNREHDYGGIVDNQLRALDHAGFFKTPLTAKPETLPKYVNPYDTKAELTNRARTYLQVNCSICHVADGGGNSLIELDYKNTLEATKTVGARPVQGTFNISDAMIIAPGDPLRSVMYYRLSSLGGARMPRVGSRVIDERALDLFYDWISKMPDIKISPATSAKADREEIERLTKRLQEPAPAGSSAQNEAIRRLTANTSRSLALARTLAHGDVSPSVRSEVLAVVKEHPAVEVRDLFERFIPESERVKRLGETINPKEILSLSGNAARGRAIFAAESIVNCKSCHKLGDIGVEVGPDLSKIGGKYPRAELLHQILEPSYSIDPKYVVYQIETRAGQVRTGLLLRRDEKEVILKDAQNQEVRVATADIEVVAPCKQSLMPDLLLRSLNAQQAADLLEYLVSLKQ